MKTEKMTYVKALEYILENCDDLPQEIADKITQLKASLEKKNNNTKLTERQQENEGFMIDLLTFFQERQGEQFTASEILNLVPSVHGLANQRIAAILNKMVANEQLNKTKDKRKTVFYL